LYNGAIQALTRKTSHTGASLTSGLISTKFHMPLTHGRLTGRLRLDARLDEGLLPGCRLVLVTAPAGFGKSTLVSAWIQKQDILHSWLSLDSADNEPRQFLSYFVGALQRVDRSLGMSQVNRIQTADLADSAAVYADIMANLVNEITTLTVPFILVMDDCHLVKNPVVLQQLNFLISNQPLSMRLILLTREDLPLPVSRLRVRRQLVEIRQVDLQFSFEETKDFLLEGMGISNLTSQEIQALEQRTEGWIAGLQLAALSIKYSSNREQFIQSFTGSDRYILDYLLDEVFSLQSEEMQNFLLATSILDRFCASLCDVVLDDYEGISTHPDNRSRSLLEQAERSHLFLIPLDNQRQWYRYHHLFADLLRNALVQAASNKITDLHLGASQWLEANGYIQEAVHHAFLSKDWEYAADMVERHAWNMILHSQVAMVSEWCSHFPEYVMGRRPALCVFHGWALIIAFKKDDFPAANVRIEQAEAALAGIDLQATITLIVDTQPISLKKWVTGQITLLRSFILMAAPRKQANPEALIEFGKVSYDQLPAEDATGRSVSLLDICYAFQAQNNVAVADKMFEQVIVVASSGGNYFGAVVAEYHRAHGLFAQGRLREVISFCQQKRKIYEGYFNNPIRELPAIALLDQAEGCALLELNQVTEAEQFLRKGLEVGQWMPREELPGYLTLARLCAIKGDSDGMLEALRRLDMRWPDIRYCTQSMRVLYALKSYPDDPDTRNVALNWTKENPPEIGLEIVLPGIGPAWNDEGDYAVFTAWTQVQIILGNTEEALSAIQPMLKIASEHQLNHRVIELSLMQAQAYFVQGQKERAWKPLRLAVSHGEREGYLRLLDQGPVLLRLFKEAEQLGVARQYIRRNLEALLPGPALKIEQEQAQKQGNLSANRNPARLTFDSDGLLEPLSPREIEVLALMAQGLTNTEIARRLYLSPNTLKAHTQNIYSKLDIHSRIHAVNKARELKLI
jgi:LuxR family transcriptional regulator, maltose regulon positive regulatory protein